LFKLAFKKASFVLSSKMSGTLVAVTNPFLSLIFDYGEDVLFYKAIEAANYNGGL
jgi:hypothetical protein